MVENIKGVKCSLYGECVSEFAIECVVDCVW